MRFIPIIINKITTKRKSTFYQQMNVSFPEHVSSDNKELDILVRCVDYEKYPDYTFKLYNDQSNSCYIYNIIPIEDPNNIKTIGKIIDTSNCRTYQSYWAGFEDIRFITSDKILVTTTNLHPSGYPRVFLADFDRATCSINNIILLNYESHLDQKNWLPFNKTDGGTNVIYSVYPLIVLFVSWKGECSVLEKINVDPVLSGYHGSTNGVIFPNTDHFLFLIHKTVTNNTPYVIHRWLLLSKDLTNVRFSAPFKFFQNSYIEFPCSIRWNNNDELWVGLGVNDNSSFIAVLSYDEIYNSIL